MLNDFLSGLTDLLAPPRCAGCMEGIEARGLVFCRACEPLVELAPAPEGALRDRDACIYGGPLRDAIHRLKYAGHSELASGLAQWLVEAAQAFTGAIDVVAPVPLHPGRLRERGYNQSALLARPVAHALSVPYRPTLLVRPRPTRAQVGRDREERARSLDGALVASSKVRNKRVLVIDDVRTTGATLEEARRALRAAGATAVYTLALAVADDLLEVGADTV